MSKVIDFNDKESIFSAGQDVSKIADTTVNECITQAAALLTESIDFDPADAIRILSILGIDSSQNPRDMYKAIRNSEDAFILRKKFFDSSISQENLEIALIDIISEMTNFIAGNVVQAIIDFVKSVVKICSFNKSMSEYKELTFRFFTKSNDDVVVMLIINISYDDSQRNLTFGQRLFNFLQNKVHLSFFAGIVKTSFNLIRK